MVVGKGTVFNLTGNKLKLKSGLGARAPCSCANLVKTARIFFLSNGQTHWLGHNASLKF